MSTTPGRRMGEIDKDSSIGSDSLGESCRGCEPLVFETRNIGDCVFKLLEIPEICIPIMDNPVVQRLRNLKQLGPACKVYPAATHDRFVHSLGVAHLSLRFLKKIAERIQLDADRLTPDECPDPPNKIDALCVVIAAMCHDLGHGPFSHFYDAVYLPAEGVTNWKHEEGSVLMFDYMLEKYPEIRQHLELHGFVDRDFEFIRELIVGPRVTVNGMVTEENWPYKGRGTGKSYLYEIVANKLSGIDVDKFEYLKRDACMLGIESDVQLDRYFCFTKIMRDQRDGLFHITQPEKDVDNNIYPIFLARSNLHKKAYQHRTVKGIELMYLDVMKAATDHFQFEGSDGQMVGLRDCHKDPAAFMQLDDTIFQRIQWSSNPALGRARSLLEDIQRRRLYSLVAEVTLDEHVPGIVTAAPEAMVRICEQRRWKSFPAEAARISLAKIDFGRKSADPVEDVPFYRKHSAKVYHVKASQIKAMVPNSVFRQVVRVYTPLKEKDIQRSMFKAFEVYCMEKKFPDPRDCCDISGDDGLSD